MGGLPFYFHPEYLLQVTRFYLAFFRLLSILGVD